MYSRVAQLPAVLCWELCYTSFLVYSCVQLYTAMPVYTRESTSFTATPQHTPLRSAPRTTILGALLSANTANPGSPDTPVHMLNPRHSPLLPVIHRSGALPGVLPGAPPRSGNTAVHSAKYGYALLGEMHTFSMFCRNAVRQGWPGLSTQILPTPLIHDPRSACAHSDSTTGAL